MKTNQEMVRYIGQYSVIQRTSDGFFDANSLLKEWNGKSDNPKREMKKFLSSPKTEEFITALRLRLAQSQKCDMVNISVLDEVKGRNSKKGRTFDNLMSYLRKQYSKRNYPAVFLDL